MTKGLFLIHEVVLQGMIKQQKKKKSHYSYFSFHFLKSWLCDICWVYTKQIYFLTPREQDLWARPYLQHYNILS